MYRCEALHGGSKSVSVVPRPNAPQLDYQLESLLDRAERHGVSIKRFALSTHVIELDDGVLPLKASSRFFFGRFEAGSSASDRALPAAAGKRNQSEV
jgi:hypothetical protein